MDYNKLFRSKNIFEVTYKWFFNAVVGFSMFLVFIGLGKVPELSPIGFAWIAGILYGAFQGSRIAAIALWQGYIEYKKIDPAECLECIKTQTDLIIQRTALQKLKNLSYKDAVAMSMLLGIFHDEKAHLEIKKTIADFLKTPEQFPGRFDYNVREIIDNVNIAEQIDRTKERGSAVEVVLKNTHEAWRGGKLCGFSGYYKYKADCALEEFNKEFIKNNFLINLFTSVAPEEGEYIVFFEPAEQYVLTNNRFFYIDKTAGISLSSVRLEDIKGCDIKNGILGNAVILTLQSGKIVAIGGVSNLKFTTYIIKKIEGVDFTKSPEVEIFSCSVCNNKVQSTPLNWDPLIFQYPAEIAAVECCQCHTRICESCSKEKLHFSFWTNKAKSSCPVCGKSFGGGRYLLKINKQRSNMTS